MDFSYIKSASSCPPSCDSTGDNSAGGIGPSGGDPGLPLIPGNPGVPAPPGNPVGPGNPDLVGGVLPSREADPGREIPCVKVEIIPPEAEVAINGFASFNLRITYANGQTGFAPHWNAVWSSSDDAIATFDNPTLFQSSGFLARGVSAGEVTVTATYSSPSTRNPLAPVQYTNWYGACNATVTAELTVTSEVTNPCDKPALVFNSGTDPVKLIVAGGDGIHEGGFAQVGQPDWPFTATLEFADGHTEDVSQFVSWSSSSTSVATIDCFGMAHPVGIGTTTITAHLPEIDGSATLEIVGPASVTAFGTPGSTRPIDSTIILDRSASMMLRDEQGLTRVDRAIAAAKMFLNNAGEGSQVALISFAGVWIAGETEAGPALTEPDATLDLTLTTDRAEIRRALSSFSVRGPCPILEGVGTRCATGIGAGLEVAKAELESDRTIYGHKRLALILSDGCNNVLPIPGPIAEEMKTDGVLVAVVALDVKSCVEELRALASPGLFFESVDSFELSYVMASVVPTLQYAEMGYPWYYSGGGGYF